MRFLHEQCCCVPVCSIRSLVVLGDLHRIWLLSLMQLASNSPTSSNQICICTFCKGCIRWILVFELWTPQAAPVVATNPYAPLVRQNMQPVMPPQQGPPLQDWGGGAGRGSTAPARGGRGSGRRDPRQRW